MWCPAQPVNLFVGSPCAVILNADLTGIVNGLNRRINHTSVFIVVYAVLNKEKLWHGGTVFYEDEYPGILFAKDGEIFDLNGKQTVEMGGAYSIDKAIRLAYGWGWWEDEQPTKEIKRYVEQQLEKSGWKVDVVLSHTTPLKYVPVEVFMSGVDQSRVDKSTEIWLDYIEEKLFYDKWYCGHYHTEKKINKLEIMFENFDEFCG